MPNALIYARISKDQKGEKLGVERQERLCRELARDRKLTVVGVLVDNDVSAYERKRPRRGFEAMVSALKAGEASVVVTYHADRLYRRALDLERLVDLVEETGTKVLTVAAGPIDLGSASGRMVARMLGAAAQHESERLSERSKVKHDEIAAKGSAPGGKPPFGYRRRGSSYVIHEPEARGIRLMADLALEGRSLNAIGRALKSAKITTREGREWHPSSVRESMLNPAIAGLRVHRREIAGTGTWEPILDRETWEAVRAVVADPARKRSAYRSYLLSGLVASVGGDPMTGRAIGGVRRYATRTPAKVAVDVKADPLEDFVVASVLTLLDEGKVPTEPQPTDSGVERIESELAELAALRGQGSISLAEWMAARSPLLERLEDARRDAGSVRRVSQVVRSLSKPGAARRGWSSASFDDRRALVASYVERVIVLPAHRGRWTTIQERLDPERGGGIAWHR